MLILIAFEIPFMLKALYGGLKKKGRQFLMPAFPMGF
jgi:hypothetical protein